MKPTFHLGRTQIDPKAGPQADAFFVDSKTGSHASGYFGAVVRKVEGDTTVYTLPFNSVRVVTADVTLTAEDNGATVVLDSTDPIVVTLPNAKAGLQFDVFVLQADNAHAVSPQAADAIAAKGLTATVDKDLLNSTSAVYDIARIRAVSDSLWIAEVVGTWTKAA